MKFTIALYGSFKDSAGYTWKLPHGYNKEQFEDIIRKGIKQYSDGRQLGENELYGGYYIDVQNDLFLAFRFIDGGPDALDRSGVVITNWAITQYSNVAGKDLRPLFESLILKQMPMGNSIEVDLLNNPVFSCKSSDSFWGTERVISGEDAIKCFQLPATKLRHNSIIEFKITDNQKESSIKYLSYALPTSPKTTNLDRSNPIVERGTLFKSILLIVVCIVCFPFFLSKNTNKTSLAQTRKEHIIAETKNLEERWIIWTPFCVWKKDIDGQETIVSSSKKNVYSWGEFCLEQSQIVVNIANQITLNSNECTINPNKDTNRPTKYNKKSWKIVFDPKDLQGECKLLGSYYLYDKRTGEKCALLSIENHSISFKDCFISSDDIENEDLKTLTKESE